MKADIVVIGGGPAGLAAAIAAYDRGAKDVLILERDSALGGVLNQCIHNGFGLTRVPGESDGPGIRRAFYRRREGTGYPRDDRYDGSFAFTG